MIGIDRVAVVILTYRRPTELAALLPRLHDQIQRSEHNDFEIIVVDNDPDASARELVETDQSARYVHEPAPGIAHARNRALDETLDAHLLIFIDDDERPYEEWLAAMLGTYRASAPAGVTGPVYPVYEVAPEPWVTAGGFFDRKQWPEGHEMPAAGTGNLLLDLNQIRPLGLRFEERFGMTGGSDHLFTRSLIRQGGRILWSTKAAVTDEVPSSRLTRAWILRRQYRFGNTWSRTSLELSSPGPPRLIERLKLTARGVARIAYGGGRSLVGFATRSLRHSARGRRSLSRGLGMVAGAWGSTYTEYHRSGPNA